MHREYSDSRPGDAPPDERQSNSSGNFQKVTQAIPVKIAFTNTAGLPLVPGMNSTEHIHKHN
jgi:multidrug resistance efflux pump